MIVLFIGAGACGRAPRTFVCVAHTEHGLLVRCYAHHNAVAGRVKDANRSTDTRDRVEMRMTMSCESSSRLTSIEQGCEWRHARRRMGPMLLRHEEDACKFGGLRMRTPDESLSWGSTLVVRARQASCSSRYAAETLRSAPVSTRASGSGTPRTASMCRMHAASIIHADGVHAASGVAARAAAHAACASSDAARRSLHGGSCRVRGSRHLHVCTSV